MPEQERRGQLPFDLHCAEEQVRSASYTPQPGGDGGLFSCSVGPLADRDVASLERAVRDHTPVRLLLSEQPLLLTLVTLERRDPQSVRIVAHVVKETA
jgi:hypothetical protein